MAKGVDRKKTKRTGASRNNRRKRQEKPKGSSGEFEFPVVGIGASAGGLEAFTRFLRGVPEDSGAAYVLVQHLDPNHESLMAELLGRHASIPVVEAEDGMALKPNHVYMIPPNKFIRIADKGLFLDKPIHRRGTRMPIDYFFRSLAEARREAAVCIILSGTGTDGTLGLKDVKAAGGMAMVQKPDAAEYDGMPRSALSTGMVDFVLSIDDMPDALLNYLKHPYLTTKTSGSISQSQPDAFRGIVNLLRAHMDYDFRCYKPGTLDRRIHRRMSLRHIRDPLKYLSHLREDREELHLLFKDLLIGVTRFFRDPEVWEALRHDVIAPLIEAKDFEEAVRIWVVGCSTGEEAYSLAIMLYEEFEAQQKNLPVQIYATDLDPDAIEAARTGWYPASIASDVTPQRISRFFVEEGDGYRVGKRLRESVVFATQNVISDPPFSRLDLLSCRNLLIYLEPEVQRRLLELFHFALGPDGFLLLGTSETTSQSQKMFDAVSKSSRIFRRTGALRPGQGAFPIIHGGSAEQRRVRNRAMRDLGVPSDGAMAETAKRILLEQFAPASVLVNRQFEVQYYHGPVRDYLDYPAGEPELELPNLALQGLKAKLRRNLTQAMRNGEAAEDVARSVKRNGGSVSVRIHVQPIAYRGDDAPLLLVSFRDDPLGQGDVGAEPQAPATPEEVTMVQQLEYELQATREDLQSTIEELETANEELKASNEEVMSMNEELQSSNEELETSREELQSLNEELTTVNSQLQEKVQELEDANNDLANLLVSTEIATLFLDTSLSIRRFTPAASELLHIIDGDVGRPINDLAPRINDTELLKDARAVLRRLQPIEAEVGHDSGRTFLRRVVPYRASDNKIDGVVITFADVTNLRTTADQLKRREAQQGAIAELGRLGLSRADTQTLLDDAVEKISKQLDCPLVKVLELTSDASSFVLRAGVGWSDAVVGRTLVSAENESLGGFTLKQRGPVTVENLQEETRFKGLALLNDHGAVSGVSVIVGTPEMPWGVLGAYSRQPRRFTVDDVNFLQSVANLLLDAIERERMTTRLQLALDAADLATWEWDPRTDATVWHERLYDLIDVPLGTPTSGALFFKMVHPDDVAEFRRVIEVAIERRGSFEHEFRVVRRDGTIRWLTAIGMTVVSGPEGAVRLVGINRDITADKIAKQRLAESEERFRLAMEATDDVVYDWDLVKDIAQRSEGMHAMIGVRPADAPPERAWWEARVHPDDREKLAADLATAIDTGEEYYEMRYRVRHEQDNAWVHVYDQGKILRDDEGRAYRIVGSRRDMTHQIDLDNRLRAAEERRRLALTATETGTWEWRAGSNEMIWDARQCDIFGIEHAECVPLDVIRDQVHPADAEARDERLLEAMRESQPYAFEFRLVAKNGHSRWVTEKGNAQGEGQNKRLIGISYDVTDSKEAQARDAMLMAELDHRVKNILANIQAVARQSIRGKADLREFVTALEGRLHALSDTHSLLSTARWTGVDLQALLEAIFAPYASPGGIRLTLDGPGITLTPGAAQSFALTIHELVTNAAKYGALSKDDGRVAVEWQENMVDDAPVVTVRWQERKGPRVAEPEEKHFGLAAIENLLSSELDATVEMDFKPSGLVCQFTIPRDRFIANSVRPAKPGIAENEEPSRHAAIGPDATDIEGLRVMVVEDSWAVASQLKFQLEGLGCEVVGPASSVDEAMALSEVDGIDVGLLDVQLGEEKVFPVAGKLAEVGVPHAFITGYTDPALIPEAYRDALIVAKPYTDDSLVSTLRRLIQEERVKNRPT